MHANTCVSHACALILLSPLQCDVHFNKYIKPQLSGEASTGKGGAAGKKGKGPSGKAVYAKFASKQKDMHGALVEKLAEAVHASLMDGAANGFNTLTLTSFRCVFDRQTRMSNGVRIGAR